MLGIIDILCHFVSTEISAVFCMGFAYVFKAATGFVQKSA